MITYNVIKNNEAITTYIRHADKSLEALGYTEHSLAHVTRVARWHGVPPPPSEGVCTMYTPSVGGGGTGLCGGIAIFEELIGDVFCILH